MGKNVIAVGRSLSSSFEEDFAPYLDDRLDCLRQELDLRQNPRAVNQHESELLLELLEGWAHKECWDAVVEWASCAVLEGCPKRFLVPLYRFWLEGLIRGLEWDSARVLSRHILGFRFSSHEFVALSLYGLSLIGVEDHARRIARVLQSKTRKTTLEAEALAVFNLMFRGRRYWGPSLSILEKVSIQGRFGYFAHLNCVSFSLDCDDHLRAGRALNAFHRSFPYAPEPIRAALALAASESNWREAVRLSRELCRINPQETENFVVLAGALEYGGELFAARDVLRRCAASVEPDDYDFVVTAGAVAFKLYRAQGDEHFRSEAIRFLSRALTIGRAYRLPGASVSSLLHQLKAGAGEPSIPPPAGRIGSGPSFWLCLVNDHGWKHGLPRRSQLLVRVPEECQMGDFIFLARGSDWNAADELDIHGLLRVASPQIPDEYLERVVRIDGFKMFDAPIRYNFAVSPEPAHDGHGIYNFSNVASLYFYEIQKDDAESIVGRVESLDHPLSFEQLVNKYA
jgi:hypothetical protein